MGEKEIKDAHQRLLTSILISYYDNEKELAKRENLRKIYKEILMANGIIDAEGKMVRKDGSFVLHHSF